MPLKEGGIIDEVAVESDGAVVVVVSPAIFAICEESVRVWLGQGQSHCSNVVCFYGCRKGHFVRMYSIAILVTEQVDVHQAECRCEGKTDAEPDLYWTATATNHRGGFTASSVKSPTNSRLPNLAGLCRSGSPRCGIRIESSEWKCGKWPTRFFT